MNEPTRYHDSAANKRADEYFNRVVTLKPVILADEQMAGRMGSVFRHHIQSDELDPEVVLLGEGYLKVNYGVGKVHNPETGQDLYIAMKLSKGKSLNYLFAPGDMPITGLFADLEKAFAFEKNVPYFTGTVAWRSPQQTPFFAILTEDMTNGGDLEVEQKRYFDHDVLLVDGSQEVIIEPTRIPLTNPMGFRYFSDEARIDLPD